MYISCFSQLDCKFPQIMDVIFVYIVQCLLGTALHTIGTQEIIFH